MAKLNTELIKELKIEIAASCPMISNLRQTEEFNSNYWSSEDSILYCKAEVGTFFEINHTFFLLILESLGA